MADHNTTGPAPFLNPTTRLIPLHKPAPPAARDGGEVRGDVYHVWRSRDNRKGRHALALTPSARASAAISPSHAPLAATATASATLRGISRMLLCCPVWDVSYDVAVIFTLGSAVWVLNGFLVLLPYLDPAASWAGESAWGGGVSAVVGATIFEVGSALLMLEAVNENRSDCFGWAVEEALAGLEHACADADESPPVLLLLRRDKRHCRHHHRRNKSFLTGRGADRAARAAHHGADNPAPATVWTWWPAWEELRTHYLRDIGFLACLSQMMGATVFWVSGFTGLPQVQSLLATPANDGIFWLPQVVGGTGFIISSWLFMFETQPNWHTPSPGTLGWHIGLWNLLGALGFTLCGALGFASGSSRACEAGSLWSTFIGSWAFLAGSIIQWYEALDKYPVTVFHPRQAADGPGSSSSTGSWTTQGNRASHNTGGKEPTAM